MYKHYEMSDDVFVDREEYIDWMKEALEHRKNLAKKFPDQYALDLASTYHNLSLLQESKEMAEKASEILSEIES